MINRILIYAALLFLTTSCSEKPEAPVANDDSPTPNAKNVEHTPAPIINPTIDTPSSPTITPLPPAPGPAPRPVNGGGGGGGGSQGAEKRADTGNPDNDQPGGCETKEDGPTGITCATGEPSPCNVGEVICTDGKGECVSVLFPCSIELFSAPTTTDTEDGPVALVLATFNDDDNLDLAVVNRLTDNITIFLGAGDGTFGTGTNFTVGDEPSAIVAADFNADSNFDLAVANRNSDNVTILLGDGAGSFTPSATSPVAAGNGPVSIAVGEVNGDAFFDLAIANQDGDQVTVLLGAALAAFAPAGGSPFAAGNEPVSLALGDLDGDGDADLVVANQADSNALYYTGNNTGAFVQVGSLTTGLNPSGVALEDLDDDSDLDIAVSNFGSDNVTVFLNAPSLNFTNKTNYLTGDGPRGLALGDINDDAGNAIDIVTANFNSDNISYLFNFGDGTFSSKTDQAAGDGPSAIALGDLNGDGKLDAVVTLATANQFAVLLNTLAP